MEAIERSLLEAAREAFRTHGFDAASMEAIAAAAKVSKSTLYSRYPTKDALLNAVTESQIADWTRDRARLRGPLPGDFKQRLLFHARATLDALMSSQVSAFEQVLHGASCPAREHALALYRTAQQQALDELTQEIVQGTSHFPVPLRDPRRVAEMLLAQIYGWYAINTMIGAVTPEEANSYAEHAVDVVFAGRAAW